MACLEDSVGYLLVSERYQVGTEGYVMGFEGYLARSGGYQVYGLGHFPDPKLQFLTFFR